MGTDKSLKDKTVKVKGGASYAMVKDRIMWLDENKSGAYSIDTKHWFYPEQKTWVVKAVLTVDSQTYTGHAQEVESDDSNKVNFTSALENAETSAIGRACAAYGLGIQDSYASGDEVVKAVNRSSAPRRASVKQIELLVNKVKWGTPIKDKDGIIQFIDEAIGKSLTELKIDEVDDAIAKLDQAIRDGKMNDKVGAAVGEDSDVVYEVPDGDINLDKVGY